MIAICNGTDLSDLIAYGYAIDYEPQYSGQVTAIDGTDYSAKLRDRAIITVPFLPLTKAQLEMVAQLFPASGAYVTWTYWDPALAANHTSQFKYARRRHTLKVVYHNGVEYWDGLVLELTER